MAEIELSIIHVATGESKRLQLPDNVPVGNLLPKIVKVMGGDAGAPGGSRLINKSQVFDYNDGDTLAGRGTKSTDTLGLVQEFRAGNIAK